jgi:hypothetical protein
MFNKAKRVALMRKIIDVTIDGAGKPVFSSDYDALKGLNLYQRVFVTLMFEQDLAKVRKWMFAIHLLGLADVAACKRPELSMSMFENTVDELQQSCENFKKHFGGNLNFKIASV